MGLQHTLPKETNYLYMDIINAYWAISDMYVDIEHQVVTFTLSAYPSRDAKINAGEIKNKEYFSFGSAMNEWANPILYSWNGTFTLSQVFTNGAIPLGRDQQIEAIYNTIKAFLPEVGFEDVLE